MDADSDAEKRSAMQPPPFPGDDSRFPPPFPGEEQPPPLPQESSSPPLPQREEVTLPPAVPAAEFVEAERMDDGKEAAGTADGGVHVRTFGVAVSGAGKPPKLWAWLFLIAAWFFLGSRVPFTVFIGVPLNFVALIMALVCLARGGLFTALAVMLLGTGGSLLVYLVGVFRFLGA